MTRELSVIIPTLNEEQCLASTLASLPADVEVIVADGGSSDATCSIARQYGAGLVSSQAGRAWQQNAGARAAGGDILLFLHADTRLPEGFQGQVKECLAQPGVVAGAFHLSLTGRKRGLGVVAWGANVRSHLLQLPYGDQALFMTRELFNELAGFPEVALMEDFMLVRRLAKRGKVALAEGYVQSSGRKWQRQGLLRTTLVNQVVLLGFFLGLPTDLLAKLYGVRK